MFCETVAVYLKKIEYTAAQLWMYKKGHFAKTYCNQLY